MGPRAECRSSGSPRGWGGNPIGARIANRQSRCIEDLAAVPQPDIRFLLADDDARLRSLIAARARETVEAIEILEAEDGAEAMQLGLRHRPQIALLDVNMPRLDGIEVALMLRDQHPQLRVALQTAHPAAHYERARAGRLPLFDKLHVDRALAWVAARAIGGPTRSLVCFGCGYGIVRATPPERCPMCQAERTWRSVRARA